jgi:hypothetical protein
MGSWKRKPCKTCGGETRKVRGSRYCEECAPKCDRKHDGSEERYPNGTCIGCHRANMAAAYKRNAEAYKKRVRNRELFVKYGLLPEQYDVLVSLGCQICGSTGKLHIAIDQDDV